MPRAQIIEGEYYHIYCRGVNKDIVFKDDRDRWRFLTLLILLQGDICFPQVGRMVNFVRSWSFDKMEEFAEILKSKQVELVGFCLMPNHFHFILRELKAGGISKFMQRLLGAYTKYFNTRHGRTGHLFGSKYQSVHIDENRYLNYLSAYIHLNPSDLASWKGREKQYPWSSYQDYIGTNRLGEFLNPSVITDQFDSGEEYKQFVGKNQIKKLHEELDNAYLMD